MLSRPAVEAGETLGFLPGDMEDKLAPYLRPLYDALATASAASALKPLMAEGAIEIAPVGFMRGRTLNNAFVVIDEAQNCTYGQIKMLLTRLGWHSTMVVTGDPDQTDLLPGLSGLSRIAAAARSGSPTSRSSGSPTRDIVRHPLVGEHADGALTQQLRRLGEPRRRRLIDQRRQRLAHPRVIRIEPVDLFVAHQGGLDRVAVDRRQGQRLETVDAAARRPRRSHRRPTATRFSMRMP